MCPPVNRDSHPPLGLVPKPNYLCFSPPHGIIIVAIFIIDIPLSVKAFKVIINIDGELNRIGIPVTRE